MEGRCLLDSEKEKKLIGNHTHLQENDSLPHAQDKPKRKSPHFLKCVHAGTYANHA